MVLHKEAAIHCGHAWCMNSQYAYTYACYVCLPCVQVRVLLGCFYCIVCLHFLHVTAAGIAMYAFPHTYRI